MSKMKNSRTSFTMPARPLSWTSAMCLWRGLTPISWLIRKNSNTSRSKKNKSENQLLPSCIVSLSGSWRCSFRFPGGAGAAPGAPRRWMRIGHNFRWSWLSVPYLSKILKSCTIIRLKSLTTVFIHMRIHKMNYTMLSLASKNCVSRIKL